MYAIRTWLVQTTMVAGVATVTALAMTLSVTISLVINVLKGEFFPLGDWLFPSMFSPLVISPIVAFLFLTSIRRLDRLRGDLAASVERERLLALEMRHRLKNVYSVAGGLISMAAREVPDEDRK